MVGVNILQDATAQALRKSGGNVAMGKWNGYAYTNYAALTGTRCSVSFKPTATNNSFMVGLTTTTSRNTTTARYANIDYAFYPHAVEKYESTKQCKKKLMILQHTLHMRFIYNYIR